MKKNILMASTSPGPNPPAPPPPAANASTKWHNPNRRRRRAHPRVWPRLRPHETRPRLSVHERGRSGDHVTGLLLGAGEVQDWLSVHYG